MIVEPVRHGVEFLFDWCALVPLNPGLFHHRNRQKMSPVAIYNRPFLSNITIIHSNQSIIAQHENTMDVLSFQTTGIFPLTISSAEHPQGLFCKGFSYVVNV